MGEAWLAPSFASCALSWALPRSSSACFWPLLLPVGRPLDMRQLKHPAHAQERRSWRPDRTSSLVGDSGDGRERYLAPTSAELVRVPTAVRRRRDSRARDYHLPVGLTAHGAPRRRVSPARPADSRSRRRHNQRANQASAAATAGST